MAPNTAPKAQSHWDVAPPLPPAPPASYLAVLKSLASTPAPPRDPMMPQMGLGGTALPPPANPFLKDWIDPYQIYLQDHAKYVTALTHLKFKLQVDNLAKKAVKKEMAMGVSMDAYHLKYPHQGASPKLEALSNMLGASGYHDTMYPTGASDLVCMKPRVKQTPPAPKVELVAAKNELRSAKVTAKAEKIKVRSTAIVARAKVHATKVRAGLSYAQAAADGRAANAPSAAEIATGTVHARVLRRKEQVESRRVPLYTKSGGDAAMPAEPSGGFLVKRTDAHRTRVTEVQRTGDKPFKTVKRAYVNYDSA